MTKAIGKQAGKRKQPSYFYSIISISLVLFVIGLMATFLLQARELTQSIKESILFQIELKDDASDADILKFLKQLEGRPFVKYASYTSKDQAAQFLKEKLGETDEYMDMLDANPLYASVELRLKSQYANPDSVKNIQTEILQSQLVRDVHYQSYLVESLNSNIQKISIAMGGIALLLLVISLTLIDNTIRLAMFSQRFLIRSMQLVGATRWFITKPFVSRGISNGFISGMLASIALLGVFFLIEKQIPGITIIHDILYFSVIVGIVLGLGMLVSWFSTQRAVGKYLHMKLDDLY